MKPEDKAILYLNAMKKIPHKIAGYDLMKEIEKSELEKAKEIYTSPIGYDLNCEE